MLYCLNPFEIQKTKIETGLKFSDKRESEIVNILFQAHYNVFSVLFWFAILGPIGAILYRLTLLLISTADNDDLKLAAEKVQQVLEWLPVRIETLAYALISHFVVVVACWVKHIFTGLDNNKKLLASCGFAALQNHKNEQQRIKIADIRSETLALVDRALIVWLVIIALIIIF